MLTSLGSLVLRRRQTWLFVALGIIFYCVFVGGSASVVRAGIMGILYSMTPIFELAPPSFKANFMYMAGISDEAAFDKMAAQMGLAGVGAKLKCPTLITQGENDFLCPLEGADRFFSEIAGPKEMWVFHDEFHPLGGVMAHLIPWLADWVLDALDGKFPAGYARRVEHEAL